MHIPEREFGGSNSAPEHQRSPLVSVWETEIAQLLDAKLGEKVYFDVPARESYASYSGQLRNVLMTKRSTKGFRWSITRVFLQDPEADMIQSNSGGLMRIVKTEKSASVPTPVELHRGPSNGKVHTPLEGEDTLRTFLPALKQTYIGNCPDKAAFLSCALKLYSSDSIRDEAWEQANDVQLPELAAKIRRWDLAKVLVENELGKWIHTNRVALHGLDAVIADLYNVTHGITLTRIEQEELRVESLEQTIRELKSERK